MEDWNESNSIQSDKKHVYIVFSETSSLLPYKIVKNNIFLYRRDWRGTYKIFLFRSKYTLYQLLYLLNYNVLNQAESAT